MQYRFIEQRDGLTDGARFSIEIPPGAYQALAVSVRAIGGGANPSLFTTANANSSDGAVFRLNRNGEQIQAEDAFTYLYLTDYFFGAPIGINQIANAPAAGLEQTGRTFLIPFGLPSVPNALHVQENNELRLDVQVLDITEFQAGAATLQIKVHGIMQPALPELYVLNIAEHDFQASAAGRLDDLIPVRNIAGLVLADSIAAAGEDVTALQSFQLTMDGELVVDNTLDVEFFEIAQLFSNAFQAAVQAAPADDPRMGVLMLGNTLEEFQNASVRISAQFQNPGTLRVTSMSALPSPYTKYSINQVEQYLMNRRGRGVPLRTVIEAAIKNRTPSNGVAAPGVFGAGGPMTTNNGGTIKQM